MLTLARAECTSTQWPELDDLSLGMTADRGSQEVHCFHATLQENSPYEGGWTGQQRQMGKYYAKLAGKKGGQDGSGRTTHTACQVGTG